MHSDDDDRKRITAADIPRGLVCPHCGNSHFWTTHTRYPELGVIKRHKTCRTCGERIVSYEKIRKEC